MFFMWAAIFLLIAIIAAAFGFTYIATDASHIAEILLYIPLVIFIFPHFRIDILQKSSIAHAPIPHHRQFERTAAEKLRGMAGSLRQFDVHRSPHDHAVE